ncbi:MAG: deoxyribose-phosphate aldolase [Gammaproteobacteria bacterium]|nr:deoxyribose-phosphate aldolase [Gammaproteobacteria bacterium]NIR88847.1 deoxyribose-phosphate aldolase [Gammaproteobacteria bacterium]NIU06451.1 deoxyribose-phosphate aldolase [Gammaproteobacteria bacterium]NIV53343.1 deoxyribose-phosphate aldolase [Gammaproteobacteria bacterium]NIV74062.1 deoxyribose-phosphate aldolase [Gammaproteobacteria bacterium]
MIDHAVLAPEADEPRIAAACEAAKANAFHAVCVASSWVTFAASAVAGSDVKVCTTIGFPHGTSLTSAKVVEAERAVLAGAHELDTVINAGFLKSGYDKKVVGDIGAVVESARSLSSRVIVKVILETSLLSEDEKVRGCRLAEEASADFVKTSTGFGPRGATVEDVRLLRKTVGDRLGVKAAGGIRDLRAVLAMIEAGANRIGSSSSVAVMREYRR